MKSFGKFLIAAIISMLSFSALAERPTNTDWRDTEIRTDNGDIVYADSLNVSFDKAKGLIALWVSVPDKTIRHISHIMVDCNANQYMALELHDVNKNGVEVKVVTEPGDEWKAFEKGTVGSMIKNMACKTLDELETKTPQEPDTKQPVPEEKSVPEQTPQIIPGGKGKDVEV